MPTDYENKAMAEMGFFRGTILTAYSQYEWFLAKIVMQAQFLAEYRDLDLSFSQSAGTRETRVSAILARPGPFEKYREPLSVLIGAMKQFSELRNFMAHGLSVVRYTGEAEHYIEFRMYKAFKGGEPKDGKMIVWNAQLAENAESIARLIVEFVSLMRLMSNDPSLPAVEVDWD
jgi:hypothetical protein